MHCKDTILRTQNNWPYSKLIPNSGKKIAFNALGNSTVKLLTVKTATPPSLQTYALPQQVDRVSVPKGTLELFRQPLGNVSLRSSWGILATKMEEF